MKKLMITAMCAAMAAPMLGAESCIVSGDTDAVATEGSCSAESASVALETGRLSAFVVSPALDIRDWTRSETPGRSLNSYPARGFIFVVR